MANTMLETVTQIITPTTDRSTVIGSYFIIIRCSDIKRYGEYLTFFYTTLGNFNLESFAVCFCFKTIAFWQCSWTNHLEIGRSRWRYNRCRCHCHHTDVLIFCTWRRLPLFWVVVLKKLNIMIVIVALQSKLDLMLFLHLLCRALPRFNRYSSPCTLLSMLQSNARLDVVLSSSTSTILCTVCTFCLPCSYFGLGQKDTKKIHRYPHYSAPKSE